MLQMLPEYCLVGLITFGAMVKGTDKKSLYAEHQPGHINLINLIKIRACLP